MQRISPVNQFRYSRAFSHSACYRSVEVIKFDTVQFEQYGPLSAGHHFNYGKFHRPDRTGHGLLRLFDDGIITPSGELPKHPHRNIDIISVNMPRNFHPYTQQMEGGSTLVHGDDKGNSGSIAPGSVQIMSVGSDGIFHTERVPDPGMSGNFFQIWLRQAQKQKTSAYAMRQLGLSNPGKWTLLASGLPEDIKRVGNESNGEACVPLRSPSRIQSVLLQPGQTAPTYWSKDRLGYVASSSGAIEVNGHRLEAHDAAKIEGETEIVIKAVGDIDSNIVIVDTIPKEKPYYA